MTTLPDVRPATGTTPVSISATPTPLPVTPRLHIRSAPIDRGDVVQLGDALVGDPAGRAEQALRRAGHQRGDATYQAADRAEQAAEQPACAGAALPAQRATVRTEAVATEVTVRPALRRRDIGSPSSTAVPHGSTYRCDRARIRLVTTGNQGITKSYAGWVSPDE